MFKYQIHKLSKSGRDARAVLLEDILTSDVFGLMYYFPYDILLKPFLKNIKAVDSSREFFVPEDKPSNISFWPSYDWPINLPNLKRVSIEPDVVIEWDNLLVIIEAKFLSPTDPEELLREFLVGHHEVAGKKEFILLLVDRNLSEPHIYDRCAADKISIVECLENRIRDLNLNGTIPHGLISTSVFWINWQSFYEIVERKLDQESQAELISSQVERWSLQDLLCILKRKGLIPYKALKLNEFEQYKIDVNSLAQIGFRIGDLLSDLLDLTIDIASLGKIGVNITDPVPILAEYDIKLNYVINQFQLEK